MEKSVENQEEIFAENSVDVCGNPGGKLGKHFAESFVDVCEKLSLENSVEIFEEKLSEY